MWFCGRCGLQLSVELCPRCGAVTKRPAGGGTPGGLPPVSGGAAGAEGIQVGSSAVGGLIGAAGAVGAGTGGTGAASLAAPGFSLAAGSGGVGVSAGPVAASPAVFAAGSGAGGGAAVGGTVTGSSLAGGSAGGAAVASGAAVTKVVVAVVAAAAVATGGTVAVSRLSTPKPAATIVVTASPVVPPKPKELVTEKVLVNPWQPGRVIVDDPTDYNADHKINCDGDNLSAKSDGIDGCYIWDLGQTLQCWADPKSSNKVVCWWTSENKFIRIPTPDGFDPNSRGSNDPLPEMFKLENGAECFLAFDGAMFTEEGDETLGHCSDDRFILEPDQSKPLWTIKVVSGSPLYTKNAKTMKIVKAFYAGE